MKRKVDGSGGEILLFAGTTEGRNLSECLAASGIAHTLCVATEYGEIVLREHPHTVYAFALARRFWDGAWRKCPGGRRTLYPAHFRPGCARRARRIG